MFTISASNIIYGISCAVLMLLISPVDIYHWIFFITAGMLIGIFIEGSFVKKIRSNKVIDIISILVSIGILYPIGKNFFTSIQPSSMIRRITSMISSNHEQMLILFSVMLAIVALPSLMFFIKLIAKMIVKSFHLLRKECSTKYILCDSKTFGKSTVIVFLNLLIAIFMGVVLLIGAYSLPLNNIEYNVQKSANDIKEESAYPVLFSWCQSELDNYTDSIMLLEAADDTDASPVEKALLAYRGTIQQDETPYDVLIDHYVSGTEFTSKVQYSRYWHGYQIILKPLLEIMDYSGIRILNLIIQIVLTGLIGLLLYKRDMFRYFPAYLIAYLMLMPIVLGNSLQYSSCYYAFTLGIIVLLLMPDKCRKKYAYIVFVNIGIFTAYFDFLTYPMATFGLPALFYLLLERRTAIGKKIGNLIKNGIAWCIGFGGMWVSKWLVSSILIGHDTFSEAADALSLRVSSININGESISRLVCEIKNYSAFMYTPMLFIFAIAVIYLVWKIYNHKDRLHQSELSIAIPYGLIALAPIIWYAFAVNHSTIHYWFTNKSCVITFLAILFCLVEIKNNDEVKSTKNEENNHG